MDHLPEDDWQSRKSFAETNQHMWTKEIETDVTFLVGMQEEPVKAHKYILISRSCAFNDMMDGVFHDNPSEIKIIDVEPDIFRQVLLFMYCEDIIITLDNVIAVLYTAKKYSIQTLVDKCLQFLKVNITEYNVCTILENAYVYNDVQLKEKCLKFIFDQPKAVFKYSDFSELSEECMTEIIKSDDLALSEQEIYEGLQTYAIGKCKKLGIDATTENKKYVLGGLLQHVRFPLMDHNYFTTVVFESGFLSQEDEVKLLKHFVMPQKSIDGFCMRKRKLQYRVYRFTEHQTGWDHKWDESDAVRNSKQNILDAIMFSVSENVLIHGVTIYGCCQGAGKYEVTLAIKEAPYNVDKAIKRQQLVTNSSEKMYDIYFNAPVFIQKDKQYNIFLRFKEKGPESYYGVNGKSEIELEGVRFKFEKSTFSENMTNTETGQLPGIIFEILPKGTKC